MLKQAYDKIGAVAIAVAGATIGFGAPADAQSGTVLPGTCVTGCTPADVFDTTPKPTEVIHNKPINTVTGTVNGTVTGTVNGTNSLNSDIVVNPNIKNTFSGTNSLSFGSGALSPTATGTGIGYGGAVTGSGNFNGTLAPAATATNGPIDASSSASNGPISFAPSYSSSTLVEAAAHGGQAPVVVNATCFGSVSLGVGTKRRTLSGGVSTFSKRCDEGIMVTALVLESVRSDDNEQKSIGYNIAAARSTAVAAGIKADSIADRFGKYSRQTTIQAAPPATGVVINVNGEISGNGAGRGSITECPSGTVKTVKPDGGFTCPRM